MGSEHGGLAGSDGGGGIRSAAGDPWDALHKHIESLLARARLGRIQFAHKYGFSEALVTRWCTQRRLPPPRFFEDLLNAVEEAAGAPLTEEVRQETVRLRSGVLDLTQHPGMRELLRFDGEIQHLTAELSRAYYKIGGLEADLARLQSRGRQQAAAEVQADLHWLRLEVARLRAEWELLRAHRAEREKSLSAADRVLCDIDPQASARQSAPPWWPPSGQAPAQPPLPPLPSYPAPAPRDRSGPWRLTAVVAMSLLAVVALAIGAWALSGFPPLRTGHGSGPSTAPPAAAGSTPPSAGPTPSDSTAPPPDTSGDPSTPQSGGWKVIYRDQRITLPEPSQQECGLASVDFDVPRGYEGSSLLGGDDLTLQTACSLGAGADPSSSYDNITFNDQLRGTSSLREPDVNQCSNDANQQGLSQKTSLNDFAVGKAYCLVTPKQGVVWFKVLAPTGDNNKGRVLQATLWSNTGGH